MRMQPVRNVLATAAKLFAAGSLKKLQFAIGCGWNFKMRTGLCDLMYEIKCAESNGIYENSVHTSDSPIVVSQNLCRDRMNFPITPALEGLPRDLLAMCCALPFGRNGRADL